MKAKHKTVLVAVVMMLDIIGLFGLVFYTNKINIISQDITEKQNNRVIREKSLKIDEKKKIEQIKDNKQSIIPDLELKKIRLEVYDGMTIEELSQKLDKSLNSTISGKGSLIATRSVELGIDPYLVTAIILHETGCKWECSTLVKQCNNVGGQKGTGCGSYSSFNSLDEGIIKYIDNLYYNYYSMGLTTAELMNSKYAGSKTWATQVNKYIEEIRAK